MTYVTFTDATMASLYWHHYGVPLLILVLEGPRHFQKIGEIPEGKCQGQIYFARLSNWIQLCIYPVSIFEIHIWKNTNTFLFSELSGLESEGSFLYVKMCSSDLKCISPRGSYSCKSQMSKGICTTEGVMWKMVCWDQSPQAQRDALALQKV